jgi:hypothetical protein
MRGRAFRVSLTGSLTPSNHPVATGSILVLTAAVESWGLWCMHRINGFVETRRNRSLSIIPIQAQFMQDAY